MTTNSDFLAVAYSAFKAAGTICFANELFSLRVVRDLVVNFRAWRLLISAPAPIATALTAGIDIPLERAGHQFRIPGRVRAQAGIMPRATTSKTPPSVSPFVRVSSMSAIIRCSASLSANAEDHHRELRQSGSR
jgi:hypothetical protein